MINFRDNGKAIINSAYKPPERIQADRRQVYDRYTQMQNGKYVNGQSVDSLLDKWDRQYEAWKPPKSSDDWQSTIVPPFTTTIVERALAELIDQTVQPQVIARGPEDVIRARVMNHVKDYTWEIGDGDLQLYSAIKQALISGKTVWQEDYWQDKRQVRVLKKFDFNKSIEEYVEKDVYDFDDVYGETIDLRNFFIDPMAHTINMGRYKANDAIRRYIMNYDTFIEQFKDSIYDQFGVVNLVKPGGDINYYQFYQPPQGINQDDQVEVLFYWGRRPDKLIIMANDVVIRDGPNPYNHKQLPFAEGSDIPRLHNFWAKGEPELLESIQDELTTLRRMRVDRQHMDLWKMFLVSNRETLDDDEAIIAPSRFLYVDDPTASIRSLDYPDINQSAYREEAALKDDGRQVTGIQSPQASTTATESAIFKESTMKSLRLKIWLLSRELVTNIVRLRVPNISQYYSTPKISEILGESKTSEYGLAQSFTGNGTSLPTPGQTPPTRTIRTNDVELKMTPDGQLREEEKKGQYFFAITPDLVTPFYGKFDYKLSGEATFPVSKPLQQQKANEFAQHPVILEAIKSGYYDAGRVADQLSEINDFDPEKFKAAAQDQSQEQLRMTEEQLYELANREDEGMVQGKAIPGTPYATRGHTNIHLAFMGSDQFKQAVQTNQQVVQIFANHIQQEGAAQETRAQAQTQGQGGQSSAPPQTTAQGVAESEAQQAMPGRMVGGGQNTMSAMSQYIK